MRIELQRKFFVGVKVDNKLRDALEHCPTRDKLYVDGSDPRYLRVIRTDSTEGESYLGKVLEGGATATSMDDLKRNVLSILTRISSGRRSEDDVKIFALDEGEPPPIVPKPAPDPYNNYR
ncbi:MAG: hypothetical protein EXR72_14145 [Myxococcales bacterium]|nr:hypothetical protein [Myxococcales bacterium]